MFGDIIYFVDNFVDCLCTHCVAHEWRLNLLEVKNIFTDNSPLTISVLIISRKGGHYLCTTEHYFNILWQNSNFRRVLLISTGCLLLAVGFLLLGEHFLVLGDSHNLTVDLNSLSLFKT